MRDAQQTARQKALKRYRLCHRVYGNKYEKVYRTGAERRLCAPPPLRCNFFQILLELLKDT
jgi:hypothetical protein